MRKQICFLAILLASFLYAFTQSTNDTCKLDPDIRYGQLPNGLTYYIRKNTQPEKRAELRLVVNAGSVLERDDQRGIAHFLEHMAFNGTSNFPKNELLNYLQKGGVRFGADLNATTNFDYTLYLLPIPTDDAKMLNSGYQVLRDWAGNLLLDSIEIEKERGIILEEKRMRQNAAQRIFTQNLPIITNYSKYGYRIPIGSEDVIRQANRKAFTDFYHDWYRPDNMAVIIVGDIEVSKAEERIQQLFGDLTNPPGAPKVPQVIPIDWHTTNKALIASDPENTNTFLTVDIGLEKAPAMQTWGAYETMIMNQMITDIISERIKKIVLDPKSPISFGKIGLNETFLKGYITTNIVALVKSNPAEALKLLVAELIKLKQFGCSQAEVDRVKKNFQKRYDELKAEKNKVQSVNFVQEYVEHFLNKIPAPGIDAEHAYVSALINRLSPDYFSPILGKIDLAKPTFILLTTTDAMKNATSTAALLEGFEQAKQQVVKANITSTKVAALMEIKPKPGKILNTASNTALKSKTFTLSNGITVIYKSTSFKNDEIIFSGSQWGGNTLLTDQQVTAGKYLNIVNGLGLGNFKAADLPNILTGIEANMFLYLAPNQLVMNGNCSARNIEQLLQIIHLRLTRVNFDPAEFEGITSAFSSQVDGLLKNPAYRFMDTLNKFKFGYSPRLVGFPVAAEIKALQLPAFKALYQQITGNLNGAVMVFTGNIDENIFASLISQYIASIPTKPQPPKLHTEKLPQAMNGNNSFFLKAGKENKSTINYSLYGKLDAVKEKEIVAFNLLAEILQMQAIEILREEMGSTYSPKVNASLQRPPFGEFSLGLEVTALPENSGKIIKAFDLLIEKIIMGEVSPEYLQKAKAQRIKMTENQLNTNRYWAGLLEEQFRYHINPNAIIPFTSIVNVVTEEDIVTIAKKYLSKANRLNGMMNPE